MGVEQQSAVFETGRNFRFLALACGIFLARTGGLTIRHRSTRVEEEKEREKREQQAANLFDTSVLLDIATADPTWLAWSEMQFRNAANQGPIFINPIIYAELAAAFASVAALDEWLDPAA